MISSITGQKTVPFGDAVISPRDTCLGSEICEEMFTADNPHVHMAEDGVEIFTNGSGSHHELRKLDTRLNLIQSATTRVIYPFYIHFYAIILVLNVIYAWFQHISKCLWHS